MPYTLPFHQGARGICRRPFVCGMSGRFFRSLSPVSETIQSLNAFSEGMREDPGIREPKARPMSLRYVATLVLFPAVLIVICLLILASRL